MSRFREAILHCAAVPTGWAIGKTAEEAAAEVNRWHIQRGFAGIGYHYVVAVDGGMAAGRPISKVGAHCLGHNDTLGILMLEHRKIDRMGVFGDWFTEVQRESVRRLVAGHGITSVVGHNHYDDGKLCPGFVVRSSEFMPG
jgi:N-acetylmuramoyl-L-alanine amidase